MSWGIGEQCIKEISELKYCENGKVYELKWSIEEFIALYAVGQEGFWIVSSLLSLGARAGKHFIQSFEFETSAIESDVEKETGKGCWDSSASNKNEKGGAVWSLKKNCALKKGLKQTLLEMCNYRKVAVRVLLFDVIGYTNLLGSIDGTTFSELSQKPQKI